MKTLRILLAAAVILGTGAAKAGDCFTPDQPVVTLSGTLVRHAQVPSDYPGKAPYYTLELDRPVCLDGPFAGRVENIRSVHVWPPSALTHRYRGKRVTIRLDGVSEEETHWQLRPMTGEIVTIKRE